MKSKLHTIDHILYTILFNKLRVSTKAMQFYDDSCRVVYESDTDLRPLKKEIEKEVNDVISRNLDIKSYTISRNEAEKIVDVNLVPKNIPEIKIYEIIGFNKLACNGPHVTNTKEIGKCEILTIKKKGSNVYSITYTTK